jgi:hypothetical protein
VVYYYVYVRNRDGSWGAGALSVVEPFRPGLRRQKPGLVTLEHVIAVNYPEVVGNGGVIVCEHLGDLKKSARRW